MVYKQNILKIDYKLNKKREFRRLKMAVGRPVKALGPPLGVGGFRLMGEPSPDGFGIPHASSSRCSILQAQVAPCLVGFSPFLMVWF